MSSNSHNGKCEKCGSDDGYGIYCTDPECGCGEELKYWHCRCGHVTSYFHITNRGREVLRILCSDDKEEL